MKVTTIPPSTKGICKTFPGPLVFAVALSVSESGASEAEKSETSFVISRIPAPEPKK